MNGLIMSACIGPGRKSEICAMMSSNSVGCSRPSSPRIPGDSTWKQADRIGGPQHLIDLGIVEREVVDVEVDAVVLLDQ